MTVTETFPSYFLGRNPDKRVIEISYSDEFAQRFGKLNRDKVNEFGHSVFEPFPPPKKRTEKQMKKRNKNKIKR